MKRLWVILQRKKTLIPDNGSERAHCASLELICIKSAPTQEETWCILVLCISFHHEHDQWVQRLDPSNSRADIRIYIWLTPMFSCFHHTGLEQMQSSSQSAFPLHSNQNNNKDGGFFSCGLTHMLTGSCQRACPLETDPLKMLQEEDSAPQGDSNGHKWCWRVGFIFKCRKEKTFTGMDSDADVGLQWQIVTEIRNKHYRFTQNAFSPFRVS